MTSLLPPNATQTEKAVEAATMRIAAIPVVVADIMNPTTCPAALLPWLAWALSVDEWDAAWTQETQRAVIAASVAVHRRKGTLSALRAAIAAAGFGDAIITEKYGLKLRNGAQRYNGGGGNFWRGATAMTDLAYWPNAQTAAGITTSVIERGTLPDGRPFVKIRLQGTTTAAGSGGFGAGYLFTAGRFALRAGMTFTASFYVQKLSGVAVGAGLRAALIEETAPTTSVGTTIGNTNNTVGAAALLTVTRAFSTGNQGRPNIQWVYPSGTVLDEVFMIYGAQVEAGSTRTELVPFDFAHGSPDHWAEYRLELPRPITITQAAMVRRIADGVAPARSRLKLMTYPAAQHLRNGAINYDGTFAHGAA